MPTDQFADSGLFIPNNFIWEINLLPDTKVDSPEFKELLIRLYQNINSMCIALNLKDTGYYLDSEFVNGQQLFPATGNNPDNVRQIYRKVINFGLLPNATTKSVAHNIAIDTEFSFTRIYATASDKLSLKYIPIPYSSPTLNKNIQLDVSSTNVTITTGIDYSAYTICYVILEYVKE